MGTERMPKNRWCRRFRQSPDTCGTCRCIGLALVPCPGNCGSHHCRTCSSWRCECWAGFDTVLSCHCDDELNKSWIGLMNRWCVMLEHHRGGICQQMYKFGGATPPQFGDHDNSSEDKVETFVLYQAASLTSLLPAKLPRRSVTLLTNNKHVANAAQNLRLVPQLEPLIFQIKGIVDVVKTRMSCSVTSFVGYKWSQSYHSVESDRALPLWRLEDDDFEMAMSEFPDPHPGLTSSWTKTPVHLAPQVSAD